MPLPIFFPSSVEEERRAFAFYPWCRHTPTSCFLTSNSRAATLPSIQIFIFSSYLKSAAVPMWAVYQFLVSVVLLRILIVMMTITYRRIYDDLDKQWK